MKTYSVVYFGAALIAVFLTPIVSRAAKKFGLVDAPGPRKVHKTPIARVGGIVFVVATLALVVPVFFLDNRIGDAFGRMQTQLIALLACGAFVYFIGLVDDICSLPAAAKLCALLGAALVMCSTGARMEHVGLKNVFDADMGWLSWPITVLWIVGITVSMNFIDGLDGLAAGISAIVCATIAVLAYQSDQMGMVVLMLALLGSLTGFLFFNFNPATIFMGDGGAMFLGFMIAAGSVVCQAKSATLVGIALPALVLGVPILDTALTMIRRRVLDRRSMFAAEKGHIHHRLLEKGLRQRTVVVVIYGVTLVAAGLGISMLFVRQGNRIIILAGGAIFIWLVFRLAGATRIQETLAALRRNRTFARKQKEEREAFEVAQLMVREAGSFETWWGAVCFLAGKMRFDRVALSFTDCEDLSSSFVWRRSGEDLSPSNVTNTTILMGHPDLQEPVRVEAAVKHNGSLEIGGRRLSVLSRLLDERRIPLHLRSVAQRRQQVIRMPVDHKLTQRATRDVLKDEQREAL